MERIKIQIVEAQQVASRRSACSRTGHSLVIRIDRSGDHWCADETTYMFISIL